MNLSILQKERVINKVLSVSVEKITPNPYQPRKIFGDDISELSNNIKQNGILQPLSVRKIETGYEIIAGERRFRAAKLCGMDFVPCIIVEMSDRNSALMALVENLQRKDLHFFEEAVALAELIDFYGMTQEDAAVRVGKTQSTIANKLRILKLDGSVRDVIIKSKLTERHARALLRLENSAEQLEILEVVIARGLNVEATEKYISQKLEKKAEIKSLHKRSAVFKDVRIFINTIDKAIEIMQAAGVAANSHKKKEDGYIEYVVRIPTD